MSAEDGRCTTPDAQGPCRLAPVLGFAEAKGLHDELKTRLQSPEITLDASAVERVSTPCAQILLAAATAADAAGRRFVITGASEDFVAAIGDFGLQSHFSKWMA